MNLAITFGTAAALFVCVLIATAFIGSVVMVDTSNFVGFFIVAMFSLIGALLVFLLEILFSSSSSPIGPSEAPASTVAAPQVDADARPNP